jgi:hypothetical protein
VEGGFDKFAITDLTTSVVDLNTIDKGKLIKVVDVLGRSVEKLVKMPLFYMYENGVVDKKIIIE